MRIADDPAYWCVKYFMEGNMSAVDGNACEMFHRRLRNAGQIAVSDLEKSSMSP
jgi:hypothetical protein